MGGLLKAEFRKTITTGLWWGLLIPTVAIAVGWTFVAGGIAKAITDSGDFTDLAALLGLDPTHWKISVFAIARGINLATIFPMIFGALAICNEFSKKTITTTFLTAPNRFSALSAKMVIYMLWGFIYGVVIAATVSVVAALTFDSARLPDAAGWLAIAGAGIALSILMTLFGVGVGALINSVVGSTVTLVLYMILLENGVVFALTRYSPNLGGFLPNGSANGLTGSVAATVFLQGAGNIPSRVEFAARFSAGALGAFSWWVSGLIFLGYALVFFLGGWILTQRKDIT